MSSIKLAPNASGTGEFTIAAPNSNTNSTFTLPDQSGSFITTDSSGAAVLPRVDSSNEGGQINFNRAVDNVANWSIDSFGNTTTPTLRFIDTANVRMAINGSGNVGIGNTDPSYRLEISSADTTAAIGYALRIRANAAAGGGAIQFTNDPVTAQYGYIAGNTTEMRIAADGRPLVFWTNNAERARIDTSGRVLIATTSAYSDGAIGTPILQWTTLVGARGGAVSRADATSNASHLAFVNPNGLVGNISSTGTTTSYATSSDYRLKHEIAPMTGALTKVQALKPCTYKWNADGSDGEGFIAHELAEVVPQCVTGDKDAVDADGNPIYQGIDTSFLVATLTAAIQEQQAMIQTLTARIEALEAK